MEPSTGPGSRFQHITFPAEALHKRLLSVLRARSGEPPRLLEVSLSEENALFLQWLFAQAGLDLRYYRPETLHRRLPACFRALEVRSGTQARRLLEHSPAHLSVALGAMLVGVTALFRDPPVYDALSDVVIPGLAQGRTGLNVWSAGCSDGAELYSVALLLAEQRLLQGSYLLGTDCRPDAIAQAKAGVFDVQSVRNVPASFLHHYFQPRAGKHEVLPLVRSALRWRASDFLHAPEPGIWDIILCRNTTMYMRTEMLDFLWERFEQGLRPGGVLVLGKAERPAKTKRLVLLSPCIYRRNR